MARFAAFGWHVQRVEQSNDVESVARALTIAREEPARPSLIAVRTHLGFGSPHKQDTAAAHGEALGVDEVRLTKENMNWPLSPSFYIPEEALNHFEKQWIAETLRKRMGISIQCLCAGIPAPCR